ncbi:MAG: ABC transporter permease subunit [Candidatus Thorarchaeota archaeon]
MALRDVLGKRILQAIVTIFIVLAIDFAIFHLMPGSIEDRLARNPNLTEEMINQIIARFGLDQPLHIQFLMFVANFLQGDFGISFFYRAPVGPILMTRLVNTLFLMIPADIIAILVGVWIGKKAAWNREKIWGTLGVLFSLITYAIPGFWLGMIMLSIFGYDLHLVPTSTFNLVLSLQDYPNDPIGYVVNALSHLFLPVLVLVIIILGVFALLMRNSLLDVLREDYMLTAKAKGLSEKDQLNREAVPNARIPVATVVAIQIGFSVVGALLIEIVFNYHGIGRLIWDAVVHRDYPMLQASFFMFTAVLVFTNLLADMIYFWLDPRIRVGTPKKETEAVHRDFSSRLPSSGNLILALLIIIDGVLAFLNPAMLYISVTVTIVALLVVKRHSILNLLKSVFTSYTPSNLKYYWNHNRPEIISKVFSLVAFIAIIAIATLLVLPFLGYSGVPNTAMITTMAFLGIGFIGIIIGSVLKRPERYSSIMHQVAGNNMGLAGFALVFVFVLLAAFADVIAPYSAKKLSTGPIFSPPTPLPFEHFVLFSISFTLMIMGGVFIFVSNHKEAPSIPSWFKRTLYGLVLGETGALFTIASVNDNSQIALATSIILLIIAGGIIFQALFRQRMSADQQIMSSRLRLLSQLFITAALAIFVVGVFLLASYQPKNIADFHLMGTDQLGRDIFSGIVTGSRITLLIGALATLISVAIGTTIGLISGYYGGKIDTLLMRFTDIFFVIPSFILMVIVAAVVGPSITTMLLVIGIFSWATTARVVRGQVLSIKERPYVERIKSIGGSNLYIISKHILPGVAPLIIVQTVLLVMNSIFFEISLDFVGLGDPAIISWGAMLYLAQNQGAVSLHMYWLILPPGIVIICLLVGISFLGFGLDEVTNPRLRKR